MPQSGPGVGQPGPPVVPGGSTVPGAPSGQEQGQQGPVPPMPKQEINTAQLCRYGLEVVQEIVSRMTEVFTLLKTLQVCITHEASDIIFFCASTYLHFKFLCQPPNGTPQGANICNERRVKIQDILANIRSNFKRLGMIYQKCNENAQLQGMEYMHIEVRQLKLTIH